MPITLYVKAWAKGGRERMLGGRHNIAANNSLRRKTGKNKYLLCNTATLRQRDADESLTALPKCLTFEFAYVINV